MAVRSLLVVAVSLIVVAALAGCASGTTTKAPTAVVTAPTVELIEPLQGASVAAGTLKVSVKTTDLEFVMPSNDTVPGQGHLHLTLDDDPFEMSTEPEYTFEKVAPGTHRLEVELVQNDTSSFDPPVKQEIVFTVK